MKIMQQLVLVIAFSLLGTHITYSGSKNFSREYFMSGLAGYLIFNKYYPPAQPKSHPLLLLKKDKK